MAEHAGIIALCLLILVVSLFVLAGIWDSRIDYPAAVLFGDAFVINNTGNNTGISDLFNAWFNLPAG